MKSILFRRWLVLGLLAFVRVPSAAAADAIPVEDFFRDFTFDELTLSPDGRKLAGLARWKEHLNLFVIDVETRQPRMLTSMTTQDVANVLWVGSNRLVFTCLDDGYGTGGLFALDADGSNARVLAKSAEEQGKGGGRIYRYTTMLSAYGKSTDEILVVSNERVDLAPDVYRLHVRKGTKTMVARNPGDIKFWVADHSGAVRAGFGKRGREQFLVYRAGNSGDFREISRADFTAGTIEPLAFDKDNRLIYVTSSLGRDTSAIGLLDPESGKIVQQLFSNDTYDLDNVLLSRVDHRLLGYSYSGERTEVVWTDPGLKRIQEALDRAMPETHNLPVGRSEDERLLMILAFSDRMPGVYNLLDTQTMKIVARVATASWIKPERMAEMTPIEYRARDGRAIHGYLTIPNGVAAKNLPLVVNPHGGPWIRDHWGFSPEVQFLASRGYAVLQMNFRGSTGYGQKHLQAGYGQWGLAMQDDITDGVKWVVDQGIADPKRVAIYGASYGGYAAMAGLTFTPELYRCGINYVGVTDIALLLKTIPEAWESTRAEMEAMTGNSKRDRERLESTSVLKNADRIVAPVFFAYGEKDDRIDIKHATKLADQLRKNKVPVTWMTRVDEGHGYRHWDNKIAFYTELEKFLAENMVKFPPLKVLELPVGTPVKD